MPEVSRSSTQSSTQRPISPWTRLLMPSATDLIFVALLAMLVFTSLSLRLLGDAGIGWHIRTGQQMIASHAVPRVDHFSSTMNGKPWFAWEWLYDLVVGEMDAHLGLNGVVWLTAIVIATVFAATFRLLLIRGSSVCVAVGLLLLAISASMIHFLARPHVLSWLFTLGWFWVLDQSEAKRQRLIWLLPVSMLLWVNLHGGFLLAFVLLGIFWTSAAWMWFSGSASDFEDLRLRIEAGRRVRDLTIVGLLTAAATFANPYGWRLHAHIYSYLSDRFLMDHIDEFQSPNFHGAAQKCFAGLILIAIVALAVHRRKVGMTEVLLILFSVYAGLIASRNIPVSAVLLALVVGRLLSQGPRLRPAHNPGTRTRRPGFLARIEATDRTLRWHLWPMVAVIATLCIAANGGRIASSVLMNAHFNPERMPVEAGNYLASNGVRGPVFAPDYWGGYLIYRLYPKMQVAVDDRHDMYGAEFMKSYLRTIHVEPGWDDFLREHPVACVLLPKAAPLATFLTATGGWKSIYADDVAIAFVRSPENR